MQETQIWVWFLSREDPLEEEMATHSSILARRNPWAEEPGGTTVHGVPKTQTPLSMQALYHLPAMGRELTDNYRNKWKIKKKKHTWTLNNVGVRGAVEKPGVTFVLVTYVSRVLLPLGIQPTTGTLVGIYWTKSVYKWTWQFKPVLFNSIHIFTFLGILLVRKGCLLWQLFNSPLNSVLLSGCHRPLTLF